jgi:hypothetical protein
MAKFTMRFRLQAYWCVTIIDDGNQTFPVCNSSVIEKEGSQYHKHRSKRIITWIVPSNFISAKNNNEKNPSYF